MIANVSAHRRANAFAQALEEQSDRDTAAEQSVGQAGAPPTTGERTEQGELLALAEGLGALPRPQLDPEVKVVQRAQLVAAMEAMLQEGTGAADASVPQQRSHRAKGAHRASPLGKLRPRTRLTKGLAAGGLSVGVAAGAFGGVAAASSDALPGDSLYGLKRGIEDFKLNYLTDGDDQRGQTYLDQASTRLSEARRLLERGRGGHLDHESIGEIRRTLSGMQHDVTEGHRLLHAAYQADPDSLGPIQALSTFSRSHRQAWSALSDKLPTQLGDVKQQVSSVFDAIDEEVAPLQSLLPQPPAQPGDGRHPGGSGPASPGSSGSHRSTTPSAGNTPSAGKHTGTGTPSGPATGSSGDGLIGGDTGGLLDPPKTGSDTTSPSAGKSPTGQPDVTIPPLIPDLLPGLGIDGENAD
ncbi:hypothetical protein AQJ11_43925 [Streptomyces corchorusii]|uniref:DUF5667 domain-containing protein n=2 Tax=Streptomyces TaxID=1883 RepID=A0A101PP04_STRCK|nr:DUF5667 domain-containing protein [Streptomyces corchorusii]AEY90867.1 hypothetical protein SHJG_5600 [Streptomyces hygroscopicus subsp. jinggangensis 5008]AGF65025.1 hypothetical protein SHJGH_5362 [Streptomyces hygroscopicus subsp. jinggangensis TL01]KUN14823.1 hypothetical protein AQJ11_43925 [Streptomyces corchorusii]